LQRFVARLRSHVDVLAGLIGPRHLGRPKTIDATVRYVDGQFTELGDSVRHEKYRVGNSEVSNIVVERPGTDRKDEIIVVGAHYDTIPSTPGADDNASAVAMLIEVARILAGVTTRRTLRFVSFPCEEMPYFHTSSMGSQQYARNCKQRGEQIIGMLCLEMVGYYSTAPRSQQIPPSLPRMFRFVLPQTADFLAAVGNLRSIKLLRSFRRGYKRARCGLPLFSIALPELIREIRLSDNSSFWDQGYPALMITDTSFLRNANYHLPTDTPETLDYERLAQGTIGVAGALSHLGQLVKRQ
jgi:Zn-dependent M28 family amino/carboxypeptidase